MSYERRMARKLRIAMIKNVFSQGLLSEQDAKELLSGPLTPGDEDTIVDDSLLLNDPMALKKIEADEPDWDDPMDGISTPPVFRD